MNEETKNFIQNNIEKNNIPKDLFVSVAAVSDWKVKNSCKTKIKKSNSNFSFELSENRDILKYISKHNKRPKLVVGFAAETDNLKENSILKIKKKHCDIIVANNVSSKTTNMGGDKNSIHIYNNTGNFVTLIMSYATTRPPEQVPCDS